MKIVILTFTLLIFLPLMAEDEPCPLDINQPVNERPFEIIEELNDEIVGQACIPHEEEFRQFVLTQIRAGNQQWQQVYDCQSSSQKINCEGANNTFEQYQNSVENYRKLRIHFYQQLANQWIDTLPTGQQEYAANCFINREDSEAGVQLGEHVRTLAVQNELQESLCVGLIQSYQNSITTREIEAKENPSRVGMTEIQLSSMEEFENSFGSYLMSDQTKGNPHFSQEQLRQSLLDDMRFNINQINGFSTNIENLSNSRLDQLYQFENLYEEFLPTLTPEDRELFSPRCREASGWSACTRNILQGVESQTDYRRCMANLGTLVLDFLPGYGIYDSYLSGLDNRASYLSGVVTEQERNQRQNQIDLQLVLGIPILDLAGLGAFRVADNILATSIRTGDETISRSIGEATIALRARESADFLQRFRNTYDTTEQINLLNQQPVIQPAVNQITGEALAITPSRQRDLVGLYSHLPNLLSGLAHLRTRTPELFVQGNGATHFHGSGSPSLSAFLSNRAAGGLRPTGQLREMGISPIGGELGGGASSIGINANSLSVVNIGSARQAIDYTRIAINGIEDSLEAADILRLTPREQGLINNPFPVLYGLQPNRANLELRIPGSSIQGEAAVRNGVGFDEIRSIFVPTERINEVRGILRDAGLHEQINVSAIEPLLN